MTTHPKLRLVFAFLLAPLAPVIPFTIASVFDPRHILTFIGVLPLLIGMIGMFTYPITLALGLPAYVFMRWRRLNRGVAYAIGGALIGAAGSPALLDLFELSVPQRTGIKVMLVHAIQMGPGSMFYGLLCGVAFWLIVRPDRTVTGDRRA